MRTESGEHEESSPKGTHEGQCPASGQCWPPSSTVLAAGRAGFSLSEPQFPQVHSQRGAV